MKKLLILLLATTSFGSNLPATADTQQYDDQRSSLGLSDSEKAQFLSEMRRMLSSIQGIVAGIGDNNREMIIQSARYSGNRMARATPESVKAKLPQAFKDIGGPTHLMFEELVIRAETDDMTTLTQFTGVLLKQCQTCHALFKAN